MRNLEETFEYDNQNRLKRVRLGPTLTGASVYGGYDHQRIFMDEHVGNRHRTKITGPSGVYAAVMTKNGSNCPLPNMYSTSITKLLRYIIIYSRIAEKTFFDYFY